MTGPGLVSPGGSPMVVHLISSNDGLGGAEKVVAAIARSAQAKGWRTAVVNPFANRTDPEPFRAFYEPAPYYHRVTRRPSQLVATRSWAASVLENLAPTVVHVHLRHATALAATIPRPPGTAWLLTHHYGAILDYQGRRLASALDRWACRRLGRAVAVSEAVREYLVGRCGLESSQVAVVPNGWGGQPRPAPLAGCPPTAISVANFRPEKGHDVLVRAFGHIASRLPAARLVLVGSGPTEPSVRAEVGRLGLGASVDFKGHVLDIWPELAKADVFVLASWYDTFGVAALEAMAAGLPVVATATGGLAEVVGHGRTGFLVPPGDEKALAHRLGQLLTDAGLRRDMGQAAKEVASTRSEATMADTYYEFYESLAAAVGPERARRP